MRILQIATSMTPGGAETLVRDLCVGLAGRGHSVTLCLICGADSLKSDRAYEKLQRGILAEHGVDVRLLGAECRQRPWLGALRVRRIASAMKPDVVHAHTIWGAVFSALALIRQPTVFTQHTNILKHVRAHQFWLRLRINQYVAICQEAFEDISARLHLPDHRLAKIHNGVDLSRFPLRGDSGSRRPRDFVAVGRLVASKNYGMLVGAFSTFMKGLPEEDRDVVRLHIVGEGELEASLKRLVRNTELDEHVIFHGPRSDVADILSLADVYVMASHFEGLSISLIEAVSVGLPIVATDVGGNREVLDEGRAGLLVPLDRDAFAAGLFEVYDSAELRAQLARGCRSQRERLSIQRCVQRYEELYRRLAPAIDGGDRARESLRT